MLEAEPPGTELLDAEPVEPAVADEALAALAWSFEAAAGTELEVERESVR